jgi:hypothetical protein
VGSGSVVKGEGVVVIVGEGDGRDVADDGSDGRDGEGVVTAVGGVSWGTVVDGRPQAISIIARQTKRAKNRRTDTFMAAAK